MTKLKLGPLVDDKPVKLSIELPALTPSCWHEPLAPQGPSNRPG